MYLQINADSFLINKEHGVRSEFEYFVGVFRIVQKSEFGGLIFGHWFNIGECLCIVTNVRFIRKNQTDA